MSNEIKHLLENVSDKGPEWSVFYAKDLTIAAATAYHLSENTASDKPVDFDNYFEIGTITAKDLEAVYYCMQGEIWSPNGEARDFIKSSDVHHTSMSIGDIVRDSDGNHHIVAPVGFMKITIKLKGETNMTIAENIIAKNPGLDNANQLIIKGLGHMDPVKSTDLFAALNIALENEGSKVLSRTTFRRRCQKLVADKLLKTVDSKGSAIHFVLSSKKDVDQPKGNALSNALAKKLDSHNEKEAKADAEKAARKAKKAKPRYTRQDALVQVLQMGEKGALVEKEHIIAAANQLYVGQGGKDNVKESTWYYNIIIKTAVSMGWVEKEGTAIKVVA